MGDAKQRDDQWYANIYAGRLWKLLGELWKDGDSMGLIDGQITEIRIRRRNPETGEVLVIVKARDEEMSYVGFHSEPETELALKGALERVRNGQMRWREDQYEKRSGQMRLPEE